MEGGVTREAEPLLKPRPYAVTPPPPWPRAACGIWCSRPGAGAPGSGLRAPGSGLRLRRLERLPSVSSGFFALETQGGRGERLPSCASGWIFLTILGLLTILKLENPLKTI
ncbi:hypothetical protein R6Z07F_019758 [Ovis aries]